jgi:carboxyl-terminal processing protease
MELIEQAYEDLKDQFVDNVETPELQRRLGRGGVNGMLASLEDPYTRLMDESEYSFFLRENEGHFEGIGCTLRMQKITLDAKSARTIGNAQCPFCGSDFKPESWHVSILNVVSGSPAAKAGLRPNDLILAVDDKSTEGMSLGEAANLIRGKRGSKVRLLIGRKGAGKPIAKVVVRGSVSIPDMAWQTLPGRIGYVRVNLFNERSASRVSQALQELKQGGARGLLLDLRNCQGGLLKGCVDVARLLIPRGPVLYIRERGSPLQPYPASDSSAPAAMRAPMVVLVNGQTASAAEILAAALHDRAGAKLLGVKTFGKGLVQTVVPLSDGSAMVITTAKWFPFNAEARRNADKPWHGVEPDKKVAEPPWENLEDARATGKDLQYQEGLKLLQTAPRQEQFKAEGAVAR